MGLFRVCVERLIVSPFGVNEEGRGIARRFVEMDSNAASLSARRLQYEHQFVEQLTLFSRPGFKAGKNVEWQVVPPS